MVGRTFLLWLESVSCGSARGSNQIVTVREAIVGVTDTFSRVRMKGPYIFEQYC